MAVLVFLSTLFTKQHVVADIVAGVAIAELAWQISLRTRGYCLLERARAWVLKKL